MGFLDYIKDSSQSVYKNGIRTDKPIPIYMQFVPGNVIDVIVNESHPAYTEPRDINSVIAKSHYGETFSNVALNKGKYYPLFRGIHDVPTHGDQILLCDFGGVNYYLGPINTINNPNFNIDHLKEIEPTINNRDRKLKISDRALIGLSNSFKLFPIGRIQKEYISHLDDTLNMREVQETHGDLLLEGRHGNSIRIGSRDFYPNILLSNNRIPGVNSESIFDGSLVSITSAGSLIDYFGNFTLGSDINNRRLIAGGNDSEKTSVFDYNYGHEIDNPVENKNQIFITSDRIIFNAKDDNITLSAKKNIDIGAGNNLTINTKKYVSIESSNIYLGKQAKLNHDKAAAEPLVLGEQLRKILEEMVGILEVAHGLVQGVPIPITDSTGTPLLPKIQSLKNKLSTPAFFSEYHFIEDNGQKVD